MPEPAEAGQEVVTTTTRRIRTAASAEKPPEFWAYLEKLTAQDWAQHIIYLYRTEPAAPGGGGVQCGKFTDCSVIPWNDQEESEFTIAQKFGGRIFRAIVKRNSQRMCEGRIYVDAPVKNIVPQAEAATTGPVISPMGSSYDPTARVAETAMHTIANQEKQAVEIGISALANAANIMKNFAERPAPQPGPMDDITKQLIAAAIARMMAPPPDPLELLTKLLGLQAQLNPGGQANPTLSKVLDVAIEKLLNPQPAGPAVSAGAELVRSLPALAQHISEAMGNYARIAHSQAEMVKAGVRPNAQPQLPPPPAPGASQPITQATQVLPPQAPAPPLAQATHGNGNGNGTGGSAEMNAIQDFIDAKIIEIFNESISAEAAADEAIAFLDRFNNTIVPQIAALGEQGVMTLFQQRPLLQPALQNLPRLQEFIKSFLKYASESGPAAAQA